VIDIGANIGFYSCLAGTRGKPTIAIEPSPRNIRYLRRNLMENGIRSVEVFPLGLAESAGPRKLYGYGGAASLVEGWAQSKRGESVLTTTLDEVLAGRFERERLLVKIDVEGYELAVLRGATRTLSRDPRPTWLVEVLQHDPLIPTGHNDQFQATLELFHSAGYCQWRVDEKNFLFSGD
jgi:FkbM family methyltransferase